MKGANDPSWRHFKWYLEANLSKDPGVRLTKRVAEGLLYLDEGSHCWRATNVYLEGRWSDPPMEIIAGDFSYIVEQLYSLFMNDPDEETVERCRKRTQGIMRVPDMVSVVLMIVAENPPPVKDKDYMTSLVLLEDYCRNDRGIAVAVSKVMDELWTDDRVKYWGCDDWTQLL